MKISMGVTNPAHIGTWADILWADNSMYKERMV